MMETRPKIYTDASFIKGGISYIAYVAEISIGGEKLFKEKVEVVKAHLSLSSHYLEIQAIILALEDLRLDRCIIFTDACHVVDSVRHVMNRRTSLQFLEKTKVHTQGALLALVTLLKNSQSSLSWQKRDLNLADKLIRSYRWERSE